VLSTEPGVCEHKGLTISLRSDRAHDISALRQAADQSGLEVTLASQVKRDRALATELAGELGGHDHGWAPSMTGQLAAIAALYGRSRIVVSDRLHVLLFALIAGSIPVGLETGSHAKLSRQLSTIGLSGHVTDYAGLGEIIGRIQESYDATQARCARLLSEAQGQLRETERQLGQLLGVEP